MAIDINFDMNFLINSKLANLKNIWKLINLSDLITLY
jgi:hypothetical protein